MGLLFFAVIFTLGNLGLWLWAGKQLKEDVFSNITMYIRGTVRGYMGRFDSAISLERKRERLNKKNSKF